MARICAFVFNPVVRDARVVKEANSLAARGHDVTVIGLADNNHTEESLTLESGVKVLRVPREIRQKNAGFIGRLRSRMRKATSHHLHLLLLPFLLAYFIIVRLTGTSDQKIDALFGLLIAGIAIYLLLNLSRLVLTLQRLIDVSARKLLGADRAQRIRYRLLDLLKRFAPGIFQQQVDQRSRARIEHMVEMARKLAPDVVHCHDIHTLPAGAAMKKLTGCKVVYDAHEIYEEIAQGNRETAKRYRAMHARHLPRIDGFVTINESIADWYRQNYPHAPEPVVVMNATIPAPPFEYDGRLHEAAGLTPRTRILLYQGGFARKRGLEYLVESAAFLPAGWTLVMMGWGRIEADLQAIGERVNAATAQREQPAVRFIPPVPQAELALWSAGATVGVIPYEKVGLNHWFCTPNKLWEYPNAGVPVLVSPFPELRKPVEAYGYGWLLPEEQDPGLLAATVAALTDDEIARAAAACAAFNRAENWSKYETRLIALYQGLLGGEARQAAPRAAQDAGATVAGTSLS